MVFVPNNTAWQTFAKGEPLPFERQSSWWGAAGAVLPSRCAVLCCAGQVVFVGDARQERQMWSSIANACKVMAM